jgi:acetyl-CoA carboxylase biotin carboxylase subunit
MAEPPSLLVPPTLVDPLLVDSVLVANRGEIARRVIRTARRLGIRTVAVHSEADADLPFVAEADEAVPIGLPEDGAPSTPATAYRNIEAILAAAKSTRARAVHPGYGFLSESAEFARAVEARGLVWVGPGADAIAAMGDKINARNLVGVAGVPVAPGSADPVHTVEAAVAEAAQIGYPVMVKAAAGGGGMGLAPATDEATLRAEYGKVRAFAGRMFHDDAVLIERYFPRVRHVEVQILGLADGRVVALGERECSVQRRNQKLLEESPSPAVDADLRARMQAAAVRAGEAVRYRNAGTVEFLLDPDTRRFFFLEMNTRLQVEHPVTECVFGLDLVEEQLRVASGLPPGFDPDALAPRGHAIELRINAEDPKRFLPGPGTITAWREPAGEGVRVDAGYGPCTTVTPFYDSLMAKLIVSGPDRTAAIERARTAVAGFEIAGPKCNLPFFTELLDNPEFVSGDYDTGIVVRMR